MNGLVRKSREAAASARLLFEAGQFDGAVSRAYYAMFDAALAYLKMRHAIELGRPITMRLAWNATRRHSCWRRWSGFSFMFSTTSSRRNRP